MSRRTKRLTEVYLVKPKKIQQNLLVASFLNLKITFFMLNVILKQGDFKSSTLHIHFLNLLIANPTKWLNKLKQFV